MTIIIKTGDFTLNVTCSQVARPPESYHLKFTTQLATARDPLDPRTVYAVTLTHRELCALNGVLETALLEGIPCSNT